MFWQCAPSVFALLFSMLLCFHQPDCPVLASVRVVQVRGCHRLSSLTIHGIAREVSFSSFRRASAVTLKKSLSSVDQIHLLPREVFNFALYSAHSAIFLCCFLDKCVHASGQLLSGICTVFMDLCKSSIDSFVSVRKPCTWNLESCSPSQLLSKIDTLRFGPYMIDKML